MKTKKTIKPKPKLTKKKVTKKKPVRRKKSNAGRKLFDGQSEKSVVVKLEKAFALGCSVKEALFYADITKDMYYKYLKKHPEFNDRIDLLKNKPVLMARQQVIKGLEKNPKFAFRFLQVRKKDEFAPHSTFTGDVKVEKLSDERKAGIMERLKKWK